MDSLIVVMGIFFWLSVAILVLAIGCLFYLLKKRKSRTKSLVYVVCLLFGSVFCIRLAAGAYMMTGAYGAGADYAEMNWLEVVCDSLVHGLQSFSMDEDYTLYLLAVREMSALLFGTQSLQWVGGLIVSLQNVMAPIAGGAILLDILSNVFPDVKLWLKKGTGRHNFFVFSELNEDAVCLAEDICRNDNAKRILSANNQSGSYVLLFTDAYVDSEEESQMELRNRVREMGGICTKTDLLLLHLKRAKCVYYFLLDENRMDNLSSLAAMAEQAPVWRVRKENEKKENTAAAYVYVFTEGDRSGAYIRDLRTKYKEALSDVVVREVNDYRSMAMNLLYDLPLFAPLVGMEDAEELSEGSHETELSEERIIEEASLGKSEEKARQEKLSGDGSVEELRKQTSTENGSAEDVEQEGKPKENGSAEDVEQVGKPSREDHVEEKLQSKKPVGKTLTVTFLGSGQIAEEIFRNVYWFGQITGYQLEINVLSENAESMKQTLLRGYSEMMRTCDVDDTPADSNILRIYPECSGKNDTNPPYARIHFVNCNVEHSNFYTEQEKILEATHYFIIVLGDDRKNMGIAAELDQRLTRKHLGTKRGFTPLIACAVYGENLGRIVNREPENGVGCWVVSFGSHESRFSCKNIFLSDFTERSLASGKIYDMGHAKKDAEDEYKTLSSVARVAHASYKYFSEGKILNVKLSGGRMDLGMAWKTRGDDWLFEPETEERLAWLEHRRWNAYIRAQGYMAPTSKKQLDSIYKYGRGGMNNPKSVKLKIHPCLVETALGIRPRGMALKGHAYKDCDLLDCLSIYLCSENRSNQGGKSPDDYDYKKWDYPECDTALTNPGFLKS